MSQKTPLNLTLLRMAKGDVVEASWLEEDAAKIDFLSAANSYVHLSDDQQPWYRAQRAVERVRR